MFGSCASLAFLPRPAVSPSREGWPSGLAATPHSSSRSPPGATAPGRPQRPSPRNLAEVSADALLNFAQVSAGGEHTCGVTSTNVAYCWGYNGWGQLGDGSAVEARVEPVRVLGGLAFRQVSAGQNHTCGVTPSNVAYCWGIAGALGNGTSSAASAQCGWPAGLPSVR